jgi:caspase domain-containing protein
MRLFEKLIFVVVLVALSGFGPSGARAADAFQISNPDGGEVRAVIIGIDEYQHVRKLKGATADARDIGSTLKKSGVRDVTMLLNEQVDRSTVLREISALVERTKANDLIFFAIAGHGTQEPERVKGSQPDGMEDVFLLTGFETTSAGSEQRILGSEFNHFIRQFELRGARIIFIADTCHGGGMAREIDPRAGEMSFRQVPTYTLVEDSLKPVSQADDPRSELDLDRTAFLAAVDRSTKAPEVRIPGIDGFRGALSYAVSRAVEGNADANHDGKVTLKELFANVTQVVYQLSDQRQNIVTMTSPNLSPDTDVAFGLTRGVALIQGPVEGAQPSTQPMAGSAPTLAAQQPVKQDAARSEAPIRLASLDGKMNYFPNLTSRDRPVQAVQPTDNPDLIWDPVSHDVISWGDVVAYGVDVADLATVIDRTAAIRALKHIATQSPQVMRISPDDRQHHNNQSIEIDLSDAAGRALVVFDVSGDGTIQLLYPIGSDASPTQSANLRLPLRVREPFGADQVVAITSGQRMVELEKVLVQVNRRRASAQVIKSLERYMPADARIGSIGFFTVP